MPNTSVKLIGHAEDQPDLYDELLAQFHQILMHEKPADPLRYLQCILDERIEQREVRLLHRSSGVRQSPSSQNGKVSSIAIVGVDVGGSLSKITFFERNCKTPTVEAEFIKKSDRYGTTGHRDAQLSFKWKDGTFHFMKFETRRMEGAIEMMRSNGLLKNDGVLLATGGGAYKFSEEISSKLGLRVVKGDELHCLLWGINFLLQHSPDECYYFANPKEPKLSLTVPFDTTNGSVFPYLLVNIGSGVSVLKVDSDDSFQRVSGTMMGGGTFWGLCRLLTKCKSFEDAVELAADGKTNELNMLVGDIYGAGGYEAFGLSAETVASAFGSVGVNDDVRSTISEADIARGLLDMISQNIAQLAYLCARKYQLTRIIFAGNFLRKNRLSMGSISFSIDYWSHGIQKALFLKHEGYFGSTGACFLSEDDRAPVAVSLTNPFQNVSKP
uniref:pantothenate kinase n=1 Tax=Spongospora subterranea TaxID=70186 RepID=A0A0H5RBL0_9EUKA|eukprot:CRZ11413.1 hypothetical protein [Spongospora subterranea]